MLEGFKVVNEDGTLVDWLQQAEDRGLISNGQIHLDEETKILYDKWLTLEKSKLEEENK